MGKASVVVKAVIWGAVLSCTAVSVRSAEAQDCACDTNGGPGCPAVFGATVYGSPAFESCNQPYYWYSGSGVATLTQDRSPSGTNSYALAATSINNGAIYAASQGVNSIVTLLGTTAPPGNSGALVASAVGSGNYGVYATASLADVVYGDATGQSSGDHAGVKGASASDHGYGVIGVSTNDAVGLAGYSGTTGTYGDAPGAYGVYGNSTGGDGGHFVSTGNYAVYGNSSANDAGHFVSSYQYAVYGSSSADDGGHMLTSEAGYTGIYGENTNATSNSTGAAGIAHSSSGQGVYGGNDSGSGNSVGVYGSTGATAGYGVYSAGNVYSTGCFKTPTGTVGGTCLSDRRLKTNIEPMAGALDKILLLKGVTYEWKDPAAVNEPSGKQGGFIAQEVEAVFPKWISENRDGFKTLGIPQREFDALEVESIRTLKTELDAVKAENAELREQVRKLGRGEAPAGSMPLGSAPFNGAGWAVAGVLGTVLWGARRKSKAQA